jgi:cation transport regulator ChaC
VTLLPEGNNAICWGTAYELEWDTVGAVVEHLDYRERGGYAREDVDIHFNPRESVQGTVYIATTDNENYLGETDIHAIATQIARSVGPSGANTEYLLRLAQALRDMGADDPHVYELERTVLGLAPDLAPTSAQSRLQCGPKSGQADD